MRLSIFFLLLITASSTLSAELSGGGGDAMVVPYYTFQGAFNTGIHITNTTNSTQVVKVRFHKGTNGIQIFDFNVVLSPRDVWTGSIGKVQGIPTVSTKDTSCTVPKFPASGVQLPSNYLVTASEGYIEIIGMAQTLTEEEPIAVSAKHVDGVPRDCDDVRQNFYRVSNDEFDEGVEHRGVHHSELTSNGKKFSNYTDTDDRSLTGSFIITDSLAGEEVGGSATIISGLASQAMMTNQSRPVYNANGLLRYDPYNLNLPNFVQGSYLHSRSSDRVSNHNGSPGHDSTAPDGALFIDFRKALGRDQVIAEWATKHTGASAVTAALILTMPAQYAMRNDLCVLWPDFGNCYNLLDYDERPLLLYSGESDSKTYSLVFYDREELKVETFDLTEVDDDLVFSGLPDSGGIEVEEELLPGTLPWAVNVLNWIPKDSNLNNSVRNPLGSQLQTKINYFSDASAGVVYLNIRPQTNASKYYLIGNSGLDAGEPLTSTSNVGSFINFPDDRGDTAIIGSNFWQRSFAGKGGNYGRWIPASYR